MPKTKKTTPKSDKGHEALSALLYANEAAVAAQLGGDLDLGRRFIRVALYAASNRRALYGTEPRSFLASVLLAARLGLVPALGFGTFTAEREHDENGAFVRSETLFSPGYRGFLSLLLRHSGVASVHSAIVREHDTFKFVGGPTPWFKHEVYTGANRGGLVGAYAVARFSDGRAERFELLLREDIEAVTPSGDDAPDSGRGMNQHDRDEWLRGVAVKRLAKWFSDDDETAAAIHLARGLEKCKSFPRSINVARWLGIEVPELVVEAEDSEAPKPDEAPRRNVRTFVPPTSAPSKHCCGCGNVDLPLGYEVATILADKDQGCGKSAVRHWLCGPCSIQYKKAAKQAAESTPVSQGSDGVEVVTPPTPPSPQAASASSEPSLTPAPEASSEGTAKTSEGVQDHPRESLSEVSAETTPTPTQRRTPWERIVDTNIVEAITQDVALSRDFVHLLNTGEDTPASSEIVARVQKAAQRTRGRKAVDHAHSAAGGTWLEDADGMRNKERVRGPLSALQARTFFLNLVEKKVHP